jgi:hypothetical protein
MKEDIFSCATSRNRDRWRLGTEGPGFGKPHLFSCAESREHTESPGLDEDS